MELRQVRWIAAALVACIAAVYLVETLAQHTLLR
jgi:hypothetical protein